MNSSAIGALLPARNPKHRSRVGIALATQCLRTRRLASPPVSEPIRSGASLRGMLLSTKGFPLGGIITQLPNHPGALGLGLGSVGVRNVPLVAWMRLAPCSHTDV